MSNLSEGYYTKYHLTVLKNAKTMLDNFQERISSTNLEEVSRNVLLDRSDSGYTSTNLTNQERFLGKIWKGVNEIYYSYNALSDIEIYVRRAPYDSARISKTRYLRYQVENYLSEVYILRERLKSYAATITKDYIRGKKINKSEKDFENLLFIIEPLEKIVSTRGYHVHRTRYTDSDFDRLDLLELLSNIDESDISKLLYPYILKEIRKKWIKTIKQDSEQIHIILEGVWKFSTVVIP